MAFAQPTKSLATLLKLYSNAKREKLRNFSPVRLRKFSHIGLSLFDKEDNLNFLFRERLHPPNSFQNRDFLNPEGTEHYILGIETSCDDTGAAVVSTSGRILGDVLASQVEFHAQFGGVMPKAAQGEHEKVIDSVVNDALLQSQLTEGQLSAVAVTIGPGLSLCLQVGVRKARAIARSANIPIIAVHHMEAHALISRLIEPSLEFPFLTLLVSGGHNLLLLAKGIGQYVELGSTLDDALGEAYDKTARLLGLDLSRGGGPALEALALEGDPLRVRFKVPMLHSKTCDFSYAGLKTSVRLAIEKLCPGAESVPLAECSPQERQDRADVAASFQKVAVEHLAERTVRALHIVKETNPDLKHFVVAGGVAANRVVRARMSSVAEASGVTLVCPPPHLCTDNGLMVAWVGVERFKRGLFVDEVLPEAEGDDRWVEVRPRWPLGEAMDDTKKLSKSAKKKNVFPSLTSQSSP